MPLSPHRKNKVSLSDFNYMREVETRLFFSDLTGDDLFVLREIVDDSLKIALPEFAKRVKKPLKTLQPLLTKLETIKFLKVDGNFLMVDKEQRKNFETFLIKFDEDFEPGMEFLKGLLNRIPIPIQTQWYHLPRSADNIFQTLIENMFATPKLYAQYVDQLEYDHPLLDGIVTEVYAAEDLSLPAAKIMQKHKLTAEQFYEISLLLEYNLVCCLAYYPSGEGWEERMTPFAEWKTYQKFLSETTPKPISGKVKRSHPDDFGFVNDLTLVLTALQKNPLTSEKIAQLLPHGSPAYAQQIIDRILFHHFAKEEGNKLSIKDSASAWLLKKLEERALSLSRHPTAVEKGLHRVLRSGWIYADDFIRGFTGILCGKEKITLKNKGRKWGYFLPEYSSEEQELIRTTLCDRLFEAGFIALGEHQGKACFNVTTFGRKFLED